MAGLGKPWELWHLPFHTFVNIRDEWLRIIGPRKKGDDGNQIAPGLTIVEPKGPPE